LLSACHTKTKLIELKLVNKLTGKLSIAGGKHESNCMHKIWLPRSASASGGCQTDSQGQ
jgi:hypothetical protein